MKFKTFFKEDEEDHRKISVFDFDGTLVSMKPRIYDIFHQTWIRGPKTIDWNANIDWSNWEEEDLFVLDPNDPELAALAESKGISPLTEDEINMFAKYWKDERFVRPVPKYKKFFTGKYGNSPSNGSAMQKYYVSPRTLDTGLWNFLHDEGPVLDAARERAANAKENIVFVLTARENDQNMIYAMQDLLDSLGVQLPEFRYRAVGHDNAAEDKAKVLAEISEKFPNSEIDFFDDREDYINAANRVDRVNAIQV